MLVDLLDALVEGDGEVSQRTQVTPFIFTLLWSQRRRGRASQRRGRASQLSGSVSERRLEMRHLRNKVCRCVREKSFHPADTFTVFCVYLYSVSRFIESFLSCFINAT